jgi:spermidine synthase
VRKEFISVLISVCFFLSGAAGLIYEVLWERLIEIKVIGSAPFSVAIVLSVFMAGLAAGSYLAGKYADRFSSKSELLAFYGKIEVGVGLYALALPFLIEATVPFYRIIYDPLLTYFWCYHILTFLGCALLLIIPASLMGATLPVLCRFYVTHLDHLGTRTGWLYGINTVGAALGSLLCGFILLKNLGLWPTLVIASATNLIVGAFCIILSKRKNIFKANKVKITRRKSSRLPKSSEDNFLVNNSSRETNWALLIFTLSGFCSLSYEVFWERLLGLIVGPTSYSFTLIISTFIIGLALGSMIFGRIADRIKNIFILLIITQVCASAMALMVSQLLGNSQFLFAKLIHTFHNSFSTIVLIQTLILFGILVWPTLFLGAAFPLVNRICIRSMDDMGKSLGTAYALNTIGSILGSFAAGYILIPILGKEDGLRLVIMFQFAGTVLAFLFAQISVPRRIAGAGLAFSCLLLLFYFPSWQGDQLSRGWYRDFESIEDKLSRTGWIDALLHGTDIIAGHRKGLEVVYYGEGLGGFTTVEKEINSLGTVEYAMFNSGKADASSHGDRSTQALSAHIPLLFHPDPKNIMVLGLASGMTSGEVLLYPVEKLDIVEINEQVVKSCRKFFAPWNNDCLADPRTRLILQDGRNHLNLTDEKYDVIISEPSNPWMAGLANLFTVDFFQMVKTHLNEKGFFAQWIQAYEMDWDTFCLLGRTFAQVFPDAALIKIGPVDYLLLGTVNSEGLDWQIAKKNLAFARHSKNVVFPGVDFLVHLILTEDLPSLFGPGPIHTDNRPRLEFTAPLKLFSGTLNIDKAVADNRRGLSSDTLRMREKSSNTDILLDLIEFSASANVPTFNLVRYRELKPEQKERYKKAVMNFCNCVQLPSYDIFEDIELKRYCAALQVDKIRQKVLTKETTASDHYNLGISLIAAGQEEEATGEFRKTLSIDPLQEDGYTALGLLLAKSGKLDEAAECFSNAIKISPTRMTPYKYMGMVDLRRGKSEQAVSNLSKAAMIQPDDPEVHSELGLAYLYRGEYSEAITSLSLALEKNPGDAEVHHNLAVAYRKMGDIPKAEEHFSAELLIENN